MIKKITIILATIGLIMAIEKPTFQLLEKKGNIEIRVYDPMIIAKTVVEESYDSALSKGFRRIANYIFGGNEKKMSISMTAPVISKKSKNNPGLYEVSFVMPKKYSLEDLPKPTFSSVCSAMSLACLLETLRCNLTHSVTCLPILSTGLSAVIGS